MGDQCLFWREHQFEFFSQEGTELLLDFLSFRLWSRESESKVIGVTTIAQPSVCWIMGGDGGDLAHALSDVPGVVEHGLFIGLAHTAIIGGPGGVEIVENPGTSS